ncbi:MAG: HU family DNA-binding protein [Flavobacteriales bacterium]
MTKADLIAILGKRTGIEREVVSAVVEAFMDQVKTSLEQGEDVHMRGFGSFMVKHKAQKTGRLLPQNTPIIIPAHDAPAFKPAENWVDTMKAKTSAKA